MLFLTIQLCPFMLNLEHYYFIFIFSLCYSQMLLELIFIVDYDGLLTSLNPISHVSPRLSIQLKSQSFLKLI